MHTDHSRFGFHQSLIASFTARVLNVSVLPVCKHNQRPNIYLYSKEESHGFKSKRRRWNKPHALWKSGSRMIGCDKFLILCQKWIRSQHYPSKRCIRDYSWHASPTRFVIPDCTELQVCMCFTYACFSQKNCSRRCLWSPEVSNPILRSLPPTKIDAGFER